MICSYSDKEVENHPTMPKKDLKDQDFLLPIRETLKFVIFKSRITARLMCKGLTELVLSAFISVI